MKTKEELTALKEEIESVNKKLAELSEGELQSVTGGARPNEEEIDGEVIAVLPNARFHVKLNDGSVIEAYLSGRLKVVGASIAAGSRVTVELSAYDRQAGKIIRLYP